MLSVQDLVSRGVLPEVIVTEHPDIHGGYYGESTKIGISIGCGASGETPSLLVFKKTVDGVRANCSNLIGNGNCAVRLNLQTLRRLGKDDSIVCPNARFIVNPCYLKEEAA